MRRISGWRLLLGLSAAIPLVLFGSTGTQAATSPYAGTLAQMSQTNTQRVFVILKNQHSELQGRAHIAARNAAIQADQAPVMSQLSSVGASKVQAYHLINAIDAVVSSAGAAALRSNPAVQAVVPDRVVPQPKTAVLAGPSATMPSTKLAGPTSTNSLSNICGTEANPIQNEALSLTNDLQAINVKGPDNNPITGAGVTVAYIAEEINTTNPDFQRNGAFATNNSPADSPIITDYEDFNGDGATNSSGGEATGDASMIAAQGNTPYDVSQYSYNAPGYGNPNASCFVKVQGMAPGANVMALRVFGAEPAFAGIFVRAIQYAVDHGADVLNESFGGNPYPNYGNNDPISLADSAAVADGLAVTASSGDAGTTETLGSPSTNQDVIEVGATTDLRSEEQIGYPGTPYGTGFLSNEISPFSSGGISQNGQREPDLVAPGNSDWAACSIGDPACTDFESLSGQPTGVELFGGTSESSPITAGALALFIQAYRETHDGANPSPAEDKQALKSTATNLDYPSSIQGAGLINALKLVQLGLSLPDSNATPHPVGDSFIYTAHAGTSDPASTLFAVGYPNMPTSFSVQATNTGTHAAIIQPQFLTLGNITNTTMDVNVSVDNPNAFSVHDAFGRPAFGVNQTLTVPAGKQYLNVQFAWPNTIPNDGSRIRMTLYDPSGREAIYSRPQGTGQGWGNVEIHDPQAGKWTALFWEVGDAYDGPVHMTVQLGNMVSAGSVFPAALPVQPGKSVSFNVRTKLPASPGDQSDSVVMTEIVGTTKQSSVIPVALRSYLHPVNNTANFGGVITGGNGRPGSPGDTKTWNFRVPAGTHDISLGVNVGTQQSLDPNYNLEGVLVDPAGNPVDVQSTVTTQDPDTGQITGLTNTMQFFWANPMPGLWTYIQFVNGQASGFKTQEPFTGLLQYNAVQVSLSGMPTSPVAPGSTWTAQVTITNTGIEPENVFVDPRSLGQTTYFYTCCGEAQYPSQTAEFPSYAYFLAPTDSTNVSVFSFSVTGDNFDTELSGADGQVPYGSTGIPDVLGQNTIVDVPDGMGGVAATPGSIVSYGNGTDSPVPAGFYLWDFTLQGPFAPGTTGDTNAAVAFQPAFTTQTFDTSTCPSNGDFWVDNTLGTTNNCGTDYSQVTVLPGQPVTINVSFKAPVTPGPVSGVLDADTINISASGGSLGTVPSTGDGDVMAHLPYTYTVSANT